MDWKQILEIADDDYLIGISNKGIVKRAYKDREELGETTVVTEEAEALVVPVGGETVSIRYPLGESKCSCPSRSICRHVVLGILLAKEQRAKEQSQELDAEEKKPELASVECSSEGSPTDSDMIPGQSMVEEGLWEAIKAYPLKKLLRALGTKALRTLIERMQAGQEPQIQGETVLTVNLPGQEVVVKLLSPLEYSTCTCHKKELCSHKAEAILWCQVNRGILSVEKLAEETESTPDFDREQIRETALQIKEYLEELLGMGLCRTSMEAVNSLERLAILAHNAELPRLENQLRALADTYGRYLRRSANFQVTEGLGRCIRLYRQVGQLLQAQTNREISALAGAFRSEYRLAGDLQLVGVTWEHFVSQSGYEGDTFYFLEENTKRWYTYTNARPTFYDGKRKGAFAQKAQAPWGLNIPLEGLVKLRICLKNAKCDESGRLSSSQDTRGEILGNRDLTGELLRGCYYKDFGQVFLQQVSPEQPEEIQNLPKEERLVFLHPYRVGEARFDEIAQVLHMPLWDEGGRKIQIEVPYSKREDATIRYLERLKASGSSCFVGRLYLKGSQLKLYPMELFTRRELVWLEGGSDFSVGLKPKEERIVDTSAQDAFMNLLEEVQSVLGDLYQVGFGTVPETILHQMQGLEETLQMYGMELLAKRMAELAKCLEQTRHSVREASETKELFMTNYVWLCEYVAIARKRVMYDKAKNYYNDEEE